MILIYIDESGTGLKQTPPAFFVLGALAVQATDSDLLEQKIVEFKRQFLPWAKPEDWELKGRFLRQGGGVYQSKSWAERAAAFFRLATLLSDFPCQILAVAVNKTLIPRANIMDDDLYRMAFWQLLDELNQRLARDDEEGMLLLDSRSNQHSSVQDRRVIESYRGWREEQTRQVQVLGLPWFGTSEFYAGLQLADIASYLVDFQVNEKENQVRAELLLRAFQLIARKVRLVTIP